MNNLSKMFISFLTAALPIQAIEFIGGSMSGTLNSQEYIVTETILVDKNSTLIIPEGAKLYFKQFCGIKVSGEFFCNGTADKPVIFTSNKHINKSDSIDMPEAFDWNGIEICENAQFTQLIHVSISYCTFGIQIKSQYSPVKLQDINFNDIGYTSITRNSKLVEVFPDQPFNYSWNIFIPQSLTDNIQNDFQSSRQKKTNKRKLAFHLGSAGTIMCGSIFIICSSIMASKNQDLYMCQTSPDGAEYYRKEFNKNRKLHYTGSILLSIGLTGSAITFIF